MSPPLISRSDDLVRLRNEGYTISIKSNHLVVDDVPFLDSSGQLFTTGRMVCPLNHSGGSALPPNGHVMLWSGPEPRDEHGARLPYYHSAKRKEVAPGLTVDYQYSMKVVDGDKKRAYRNYYEKVSLYASIFFGPATALDPEVNPCVFRAIRTEEGEDSPFVYPDTASSRAGITAVSARLHDKTVAIIGLGGTGAYILDLVAKTPVARILVFDDDDFLQHNAFRSPGAASYGSIEARQKKVDYLVRLYSEIHTGIASTPERITEENLDLLGNADFVFIAIDHGPSKATIFAHLESKDTPFIDVGIGVSLLDENRLAGQLRTTLSTEARRDHVGDTVSVVDAAEGNDYNANIQVAELNALNAAIAVVRWKRFMGFYQSTAEEHHSLFRLRDAAHLRDAFPDEIHED